MKRTHKWQVLRQEAEQLAAAGLPPSEIAHRIGVDKSTVTRWFAAGKLARTVVTLHLGAAQSAPVAPGLPERPSNEAPWHAETIGFWREVWSSPMAAEFIAADVPGLVMLAKLIDRFNYGDVHLAGEIRLQRACFGLAPLDRRRLQWQTGKVAEAQQRARAERERPASTPAAPRSKGDPRRVLAFGYNRQSKEVIPEGA